MVKNLPAVQETWVQSLGWEDPPGEVNGNPLQYSCLENPLDRGAWWAIVYGVAKSGLKELSTSFVCHICVNFTQQPDVDMESPAWVSLRITNREQACCPA